MVLALERIIGGVFGLISAVGLIKPESNRSSGSSLFCGSRFVLRWHSSSTSLCSNSFAVSLSAAGMCNAVLPQSVTLKPELINFRFLSEHWLIVAVRGTGTVTLCVCRRKPLDLTAASLKIG